MSSSWGERMKISIFGGSHTEAIGVNIEGLPAGEAIDWQEVLAQMARPSPYGHHPEGGGPAPDFVRPVGGRHHRRASVRHH